MNPELDKWFSIYAYKKDMRAAAKWWCIVMQNQCKQPLAYHENISIDRCNFSEHAGFVIFVCDPVVSAFHEYIIRR